MLKAFLFDLGGTVLVEESYDLESGFDTIFRYLKAGSNFKDLLISIEKYQYGLSEFCVLDWIKVNSASKSVSDADLEWYLWESTVSLKPHANVKMALDQLCSKGLRVAAISNAIFSSKCISRELAKYDILKYFEFVISSADMRIRKPHPELFLCALNRIGISPNEALYIGDNLTADVVGCAAVGMTPVLFGNTLADADCIKLMRWSEIDTLFKNLEHCF
jgi:HAD superfamily hydrolase (TIGR01509 family)